MGLESERAPEMAQQLPGVQQALSGDLHTHTERCQPDAKLAAEKTQESFFPFPKPHPSRPHIPLSPLSSFSPTLAPSPPPSQQAGPVYSAPQLLLNFCFMGKLNNACGQTCLCTIYKERASIPRLQSIISPQRVHVWFVDRLYAAGKESECSETWKFLLQAHRDGTTHATLRPNGRCMPTHYVLPLAGIPTRYVLPPAHNVAVQ
jgi:hypothetical protein